MTEKLTREQLQQQVNAIDKDIRPSRDLWPGIEHAIEHQHRYPQRAANQSGKGQRQRFVIPVAWAASLLVCALFVWQFSPQQITDQAGQKFAALESIETQYQQQKKAMLVRFGEPDLGQLPADMQIQFTEIDSAKQAILKALKDDPNNTDLLNLLRWTQQQELSLLEQLYKPKWQSV
ncbi:hypothetical protein QWY77_13525 [Thalassotalea ponticola]|uniref:hypothetical protein n=1 Tax=Thalassotalea ponticola TaxID=1523392 RepID=UPI0025B3571E|nr:hypothetical protein [Thalassotalea ponticola]MDN3653760.1 hypothetical protein [Thalassotalea ponticola]